MTEDLFAYANTGEPKYIVTEFVEEVVTSLHWLTTEAEKVSLEGPDTNSTTNLIPQSPRREQRQVYEEILQERVRQEKEHLWKKSLVAATRNLISDVNDSKGNVDPPNGRGSSSIAAAARGPLSLFHRLEVLSFLKRARAAYGRTALCLSGGAMMGTFTVTISSEFVMFEKMNLPAAFFCKGLYHCGHVLGLLEAGVLPDIISGTSGGSVIGAIVCTRTDDEIRRDLDPLVLITKLTCFSRKWPERLKSLWKNGNLFDFDDWMEKIQW
jgi:Patatin-like phospholipase